MPKKVDRIQPQVTRELRRAGCFVAPTHELGQGFVDLVVARAGVWYLLELKDGMLPPSKQRLTPAERDFHEAAMRIGRGKVHIVKSVEDALKAVGLI